MDTIKKGTIKKEAPKMKKLTVAEFIKKWNIDVSTLRVYDYSLDDEIWRFDEVKAYMNALVEDAYQHNGDPVVAVNGK
jgi:cytidylate kinase